MRDVLVPPDPDGHKENRAAWAFIALRAFCDECRTDWDDALTDLLCDLMHLADREPSFDFGLALERAQRHYDAETAGEVS